MSEHWWPCSWILLLEGKTTGNKRFKKTSIQRQNAKNLKKCYVNQAFHYPQAECYILYASCRQYILKHAVSRILYANNLQHILQHAASYNFFAGCQQHTY